MQEAPRASLAPGLAAIAQGVDDIAVSVARKEGETDAMAFERGPKGELEPAKPNSFIFGRAGQAYAHAFDVGTLALAQTDVNERIAEMRNENLNDPEAIKAASATYAEKLREQYPGHLGPALFQHGAHVASQHYISLADHKKHQDMQRMLDGVQVRMADLATDAENAARATISADTKFLDDPTSKVGKIIVERNLYLRSLADNPEWGKIWSPERVESQIRQDRQRYVNAWAVGKPPCARPRYVVAFQRAEAAIPRDLFSDTVQMIADFRPPQVASTS